ncbi:pantoate--beta-alanine ligase [Candidatus Bipolaricaulota bacterium]
MKTARTIDEFRRLRKRLAEPVGFVPTMGYLHEGHLSLVKEAVTRSASIVASIFVNPSQFAPSEDLAAYPRDLDRDLSLLEDEGADLVLVPDAAEMYPQGYDTWIDAEKFTQRLEGASRPTHFRGVATIVAKLFNIVRPQFAVFGQKDAQQALVIRRLIEDLGFDIELVISPTVREPDGLAMSSRNAYLTPEEREAATALCRSLRHVENLFAGGERNAENLRHAMMEILEAEALLQPIYVSIADVDTLEELETVDRKALVSLAAHVGKARLIDNVVLPPGEALL